MQCGLGGNTISTGLSAPPAKYRAESNWVNRSRGRVGQAVQTGSELASELTPHTKPEVLGSTWEIEEDASALAGLSGE